MTAPLNPRAHLYRPVVDETGTLYTYATVTVLKNDGVTPYAGTIYRTETSGDTWPNPFIAAPAVVDFYLDQPTQVVLQIEIPDAALPIYTAAIDVMTDAAMLVTSVTPILILADMPSGGMLSVTDEGSPYWRTIKIDHEHALDGAQTLYLGSAHGFGPQDATFPRATVLGVSDGTDVPPSGLDDTVALGADAVASGAQTTAVGHQAVASEWPRWPWTASSTALGASWARAHSVAAGLLADASAQQAVALGRESSAGPAAVALGCFAYAIGSSISVGHGAGGQARGMPGSIGLGADAQYGLPSTTDPTHYAVLLGAHDPRANRVFPWANPAGSQSESPLAEYKPTMEFEAKTVQFQRHLAAVLSGLVEVGGDAAFGTRESSLAFYGENAQIQREVGEDEPASGIEALDSLIYALRDLGLLRYRHEALTGYTAGDMLPYFQDGDDTVLWNEHAGLDVAKPGKSPGRPPTFEESHGCFNDRPVITFTNGVRGRIARPREVMLGSALITQAYHLLVVADHPQSYWLGDGEGLVNFRQTTVHDPATSVAMRAWRFRTHYFDPDPLPRATTYWRDDCEQTWNFDACPGDPHVYRMSRPGGWPTATVVLGGPPDAVDTSVADYWRGSIAAVTALDDTWDERAVNSMAYGLMFRHDIEQNHRLLRSPAVDFIVKQHDPLSGVKIVLDDDYADSFRGTIAGSVYGVNTWLVDVPWVDIWDWFECYEYWGPVCGYWANLPIEPGHWFPNTRRYEIMVTAQRKNRIVDIAESEIICAFCWCEDAGIWTTICDWTSRGYKTAYLRDRWTKEILAISGNPSQKFADVEVRVYTMLGDGSLKLQGTSELWCDRRFHTVCPESGHKVVRVYRISTGEVLASTEWQERSLPRAVVASRDDPDYTQGVEREARTYDAAVAVMALCEAGRSYFPRARTILATLVSVMNDDGSINDSYDSLFPAKAAGSYSARSITWFGLALMYYQSVTGDGQFFTAVDRIARWLFNHQHDGLVPASGTDSSYRTEDNTSAYFFFQRYAEVIAETSS